MRRVPQKKAKTNKLIFAFVIILILVAIFLASFIIAYNVMSPDNDINSIETNTSEEYEQPGDMLSDSNTEDDKLADLRKQNAELKKQVSDLEMENAQLRNELETLSATLENQSFVQENGSSSTTKPSDDDEETTNSNFSTSENGL